MTKQIRQHHFIDSIKNHQIVKHEDDDYLVTNICGLNDATFFYESLKIKFEEESAVRTIYGFVFSSSDIEEIYFPKSLIELKEG